MSFIIALIIAVTFLSLVLQYYRLTVFNVGLQNVLLPKKRKDLLPFRGQNNITKSVPIEKLLREKVIEEHKFQELEKEVDTYRVISDVEKNDRIEINDSKEIEKLKEQVHTFKRDMSNYFTPWLSQTPKSNNFNEYDELITKLGSSLDKLKLLFQDINKINTSLESISNITLKEPNDNFIGLPHLRLKNEYD